MKPGGRKIVIRAALALAIAAVAFVALRPLSRPSIRMDGHGYYSTLASILFDHDLDFTNEMAHTDNHNRRRWYTSPKDGRFINPFPVGAAVLWSPAVAICYALDPARERYSDPTRWRGRSPAFRPRYVRTIAIATGLEAVAGLAILYAVLRRRFSRRSTLAGVAACAIGTPFVYYALAEPSYAHVASFFSCAVLLALALSPRRGALAFLALGLAWGLVTLVRYQDGVLGLIAAPKLLRELGRARAERSIRPLLHIALFGAVAAAVIAVQFAFWNRVFGESLFSALPIAMDWTRPHVLEFLFSTWGGAFLWSPILIVGIAGLAVVPDRSLRWSLLAAVVIEIYVAAAVSDYWGSASFGARRLVAIAPLFGFGITAFVERCATSLRRTQVVLAVVVLATLWNLRLAHYTVAGWFPDNVANVGAYARDYPFGHPNRNLPGLWDYPRFVAEVAHAERRMWRL